MGALEKFPKEAAIIGKLLTGYAVLEIDLLLCVSWVRDDFDAVLKAMFRTRGNLQRIEIADALGRQQFKEVGREEDFTAAINAMRYCLTIRNKYAHCYWHDDLSGRLAFVNVEELAKETELVTGFETLKFYYVDVPLLEKQERYFGYADELLNFANYEWRGELPSRHRKPKPVHVAQPPLFIT